MSAKLENYGLVGDTHTAALIGMNGSIDWMCLPRFDSAACFAALLEENKMAIGRSHPLDHGIGQATRIEETLLFWKPSLRQTMVLSVSSTACRRVILLRMWSE